MIQFCMQTATLPGWRELISPKSGSSASKSDDHCGSPPVLIVCSGARRCVAVIKALTAFRCQVLKLFAKHLKPSEQAKMLRRYFPIAVG
jgi:hypothetical protein